MRLTVRTLLAWMDEVLGPDDQRELSEKVEASDVARKLADRARAAAEKGGLGAPPADGRGLADDPNTVAEFLDNVLAVDRLEAFERVCVDSDMHLAEAAACHRLLADLNRHPHLADAPGATDRRRLLDAVSKHATAAAAMGGLAGLGSVAAATTAGSEGVTPARRSPSRRRPPLAAWLSAAAALVLLAVLGGVLLWSLVRGGSRGARQVAAVAAAAAREESNATPAAPPAPPPAAPVAKVPDAARPADEPPAVARDVAPDAAGAPKEAGGPDENTVAEPVPAKATAGVPTPPAPPAEPPMADQPPPAADRRVPHGDALAIVAPSPAAPVPAAVAAAGPTPPVAAVADAGPAPATVGRGGPLLRRVAAAEGRRWEPIPAGAVLAAEDDLLAPPWCRPSFTIDGISVRLEPNTRALLRRDADGTPRLEVVFGRAVVGGDAADAKVGITAGGLGGVLTGELRQPAGVEVSLERQPGADPAAGSVRHRATLHAGGAEKVWRQTAADGTPLAPPLAGIAAEGVIAARATVTWDDGDPAAVVVGPPAAEPAWMRGSDGEDRTERAAARALADRLTSDGDVAGELHAMAGDRRGENRMIAAATLALIGDYGDLVTLLCAESPQTAVNEGQWTILEAMTVPLALARGENAARAFAAAVEAHAPPGKAAAILALARGFSDADLAAGADAMLVESLDDGSLVVRRYAGRRLTEIVRPEGRHRTAYRADHPPGLRKEAVNWWRSRLEQGDIHRGGAAAAP